MDLMLYVVSLLSFVKLSVQHKNPDTLIGCYVREYTHVMESEPVRLPDGRVVGCEKKKVKITACFGRCQSTEIGDNKMPYKITDHPVCTYAKKRILTFRLKCDPDYPNPPVHKVPVAVSCVCKQCSPDSTSCENLR